VRLIASGLFVGALTCAFWEPVAQFLTEYGDGDPIMILQGVSVWPTVALRLFAMILSGYLFWRALCSLHENLKEISGAMDLDPKPMPLWKEVISVHVDIRSLWKYFVGLFDLTYKSDQSRQASRQVQVKEAWETYLGQERFWPRCIRAAICTAVMFEIFLFVLVPMFGSPMIPRGRHVLMSC
jgi:hypothetical protein